MRWQQAGASGRDLLVRGTGAGLSLGVAVLGRQNALAALACPAFIAAMNKRYLLSTLFLFVAAAVVVAPIFWIWGGVEPPGPFHVHMGLSIANAVLSFAYMGMFLLILAPRFYVWRPTWLASAFCNRTCDKRIWRIVTCANE